MTGPDEPNSLDELNRRLKDARARRAEGGRDGGRKTRMSDFGPAIRVSVDLVAGVAVGTFIGWALDRWLGTTPWLLLAFFLLGSAAGIMNVMRTARQIDAKARKSGAKRSHDDDGNGER